MNVERMNLMIQLLHEVREAKKMFDLENWRSDCGTAACAVGYAAQDGRFNAIGLYMGTIEEPILKEGNESYVGWNACCKLFGLHDPEARYLFSQVSYKGLDGAEIDLVIDRLEQFVIRRARLIPLREELEKCLAGGIKDVTILEIASNIPDFPEFTENNYGTNLEDSFFALNTLAMRRAAEPLSTEKALEYVNFWINSP